MTTFQQLQRGTLPNYGQGKGEGGAGVRSREATRETRDTAHGTEGWRSTRSELRAGRRLAPRGGLGRPSLTSSPFWILRLELMMILCPLSKVTTSATQFGAHEWLMYLQATISESRLL